MAPQSLSNKGVEESPRWIVPPCRQMEKRKNTRAKALTLVEVEQHMTSRTEGELEVERHSR